MKDLLAVPNTASTVLHIVRSRTEMSKERQEEFQMFAVNELIA